MERRAAHSGEYHFHPALPIVTIHRQAQKLFDDVLPGNLGVQTLLVVSMVVAAGIVR